MENHDRRQADHSTVREDRACPETMSTPFLARLRSIVQWCFLFWVIGIGIRFGLYIHSVESGATAPLISRPAGVEGFLPIGALTSLKYWLLTGTVHPVHPAALVIFVTIVLMSMLAKKSFCSWLCPVGTLSEIAYKLGRRIIGRKYTIWLWLDLLLRGVKYLLLLLFLVFILLAMSGDTVLRFLDAPYWAMSDVKMLHFFTKMSRTTLVTLAILTFLSLFYRMFWCRYLCPYGALLGLVSLVSPFKIRRDEKGCSGCRRCTAACPSSLTVHESTTVSSTECTGCLTCVSCCPEKNVLAMRPSLMGRTLPVWGFPAVVVLLFATGILAGMISGHWQTSLGYADYQRLLPLVQSLKH